jgi:hypothetical protein
MRIAICFSGQPRFIDECYPGIKTNIIDANSEHDIDIFVHTWFSPGMSGKVLYHNLFSSFSGDAKIMEDSIERIRELYKPVKLLVDEPKSFKTDVNYEGGFNTQIKVCEEMSMQKDEFIAMRLNNIYSSLYSIMRSNLLKKENELSNGFTYDLVLKMRFDNIITSPIKLSDYDPELLYHQEMNNAEFEIADWINFSNSKNMDSYSSVFNTIENLAERCNEKYGRFSAESLLREACVRDNIKTKAIPLNTGLPRWGKI